MKQTHNYWFDSLEDFRSFILTNNNIEKWVEMGRPRFWVKVNEAEDAEVYEDRSRGGFCIKIGDYFRVGENNMALLGKYLAFGSGYEKTAYKIYKIVEIG